METNNMDKIVAEKRQNVAQRCKGVSTDIYNSEREKFLRVKTNMDEFLGPKNQDDDLTYEKHLFYRELSVVYQYDGGAEHVNAINGQLVDFPAIYVSYHIGSYKNVNHLLWLNNTNFCLPISSPVYNSQLKDYMGIYRNVVDKSFSKSDFHVVDAESASSLIQLIRYVKQGFSLMLYLDGNSGIGGMARNDEKLVKVDLFGKTILSRKGIGFLSHYLKIPVIPIVSYFNQDLQISFDILHPIYPDLSKEREISSQETTQILWKVLESYLSKYPEQWEGWLYLDTFRLSEELNVLDEAISEVSPIIHFNSSRYDFYKTTNCFLFDKRTIKSYKLQEVVFKFLAALKNHKDGIKKEELISLFPANLFNQLIQTRILIS
jgi:hypothetical protein